VEQEEFPCECGAMVDVVLREREAFSGTTETFFTAQCLDCGRRFDHLEIELIPYQRTRLSVLGFRVCGRQRRGVDTEGAPRSLVRPLRAAATLIMRDAPQSRLGYQ
jgi:hypothetical protein